MGIEEDRDELIGYNRFRLVSGEGLMAYIGIYYGIASIEQGCLEALERYHVLHLIEVEIGLVAIHKVEDKAVFVIGLRNKIGTVRIYGFECKHRSIIMEIRIYQYVLREYEVGEEDLIVG